ncbi:neuronal acetylcholine receptor subunit beta-3-like isoform X2 [Toxorhynchites rutilus septentrionalis]|uniref:neuronal acetylcholine receptor subunit beta-3-like isoform X2 n=1 Tax=Toxorhynchites rutilus septentrionalis TaxID=329112 RepID=UPI00247871B0|nr:neuronal acetylcholine receptor subunit beta-3-like isoform X2 [Toxorhynchites rutilus septentrionalis]
MLNHRHRAVFLVITFGIFGLPGGIAGGARFDCDNENKGNSSEATLKHALLCGTGYNIHQRPVKNQQDRVAMYIGADVMNVELMHNTNVKLEITVELSMQWYDAFLHWNKKDNGNIHTLSVSEQYIWTPKLAAKSLLKSRVQGNNHCFQSKCYLSSDGEVIFTMLCTFQIDCLDNSRHWAFETKGCPLRIFTPEYDINQLSLFHFQRRLSYSVTGVLPYKITSFQMAIVNNSVNPEFRMDIVVGRMIGPHLMIFLLLILLLIALNLMITWFRIDTTVRAMMNLTSLALHVAYTLILYWYSKTKMEPALGLANLLLASSAITVLLIGELVYSEKVYKREATRVPPVLQTIHLAIRKNVTIRPFIQIGYINFDNYLIKSTTEPAEAAMSNHVENSPMTTDATIIDHADSDEEANLSQMNWSEFVQPFDRMIFCGIFTAYALMLLVFCLA